MHQHTITSYHSIFSPGRYMLRMMKYCCATLSLTLGKTFMYVKYVDAVYRASVSPPDTHLCTLSLHHWSNQVDSHRTLRYPLCQCICVWDGIHRCFLCILLLRRCTRAKYIKVSQNIHACIPALKQAFVRFKYIFFISLFIKIYIPNHRYIHSYPKHPLKNALTCIVSHAWSVGVRRGRC